MIVIKRDGSKETFDSNKIHKAVDAAFKSVQQPPSPYLHRMIEVVFNQLDGDTIGVEEIQDKVEQLLMNDKFFDVARSYIVYREKHRELRFTKERAEYIESYSNNQDNAATASEIDANANIQNKNVATLEAELYKKANTELSRYRISHKLKQMYGSEAPNYIKDLESHIIYKHDEGSAPAIKPYCVAVNLYPFLYKGTATLDRLNTEPPHNMSSFAGQFNNLVFLLSSQFQGAIAFGEFFNIFYYYCVKEWGNRFYKIEDKVIVDTGKRQKTISDIIEQAFQNIVYTINQPAGNRSFQSPLRSLVISNKFCTFAA